MACKRATPLWEAGDQPVHTGSPAAGGKSYCERACDGAGCGRRPPAPLGVGGEA